MKLHSLLIERTSSYSTPPGALKGSCTLRGDTGEQTVVLSARAISSIIKHLTSEIRESTAENAKMVNNAMRNASDEVMMIEQDGKLELGHD